MGKSTATTRVDSARHGPVAIKDSTVGELDGRPPSRSNCGNILGDIMKLLFKRDQTAGAVGKAKFQLWGQVELDNDETEIVKRYRFDEAILIEAIQPTLIRNAILIAVGAIVLLVSILAPLFGTGAGFILAVLGGGGAGYYYFHQKRETIFVKDLIHGRNFTCDSIIELARKEAWLGTVTSFLRQVMESAKHWDGTETIDIDALPKDEAKLVMIRGL